MEFCREFRGYPQGYVGFRVQAIWGLRFRAITPATENHIEKKMESEVGTGAYRQRNSFLFFLLLAMKRRKLRLQDESQALPGQKHHKPRAQTNRRQALSRNYGFCLGCLLRTRAHPFFWKGDAFLGGLCQFHKAPCRGHGQTR